MNGESEIMKRLKGKLSKYAILMIAVVLFLIITVLLGIKSNQFVKENLAKQLELGQKYLQEMNYEEAIIAFNKVIEIDPKNVEAYLGLADAFIGMGEFDKALEYAEKGYEATKNEKLKKRIDTIKELFSNIENQESEVEDEIRDETKDELRTAAEEDITPLNQYGVTSFEFRTYYVDYDNLDGEIKALIDILISETKDIDAVGEAIQTSNIDVIEDMVRQIDAVNLDWQFFEHPNQYELYTICDGFKIYFFNSVWQERNYRYFTLEMRPKSGRGYIIQYGYGTSSDGDNYVHEKSFIRCNCIDWQWNGVAESYDYSDHKNGGKKDIFFKLTGLMKDNVCQGTWTRTDIIYADSNGNNTATGEAEDMFEYDDEGHWIVHGEPTEYISTLGGTGGDSADYLFW